MKTQKFGALAAVLVGVAVSSALAESDSKRLQLFQFDRSYDFHSPHTDNGCTWRPLPGGRPGIEITTPPARAWPGVMFKTPPENGGKWDLSAYQYISVDFHNTDKKDIDVFVRVDNPGADGLKNCISERAMVAPDQRTTLTIPLKRAGHSEIKLSGMQGYPQGLYPGGTGLDPTNIVAIVVYTGKGTPTPNTFEVSNVYAAGAYEPPTWLGMSPKDFFPILDEFGQFTHKDWPGKIHSEADLKTARDAETKALASDKGPADWDKWGGWNSGPSLKATGHFRTEKHDGKWWLVDPDGKLFFSTGITCVRPGWAETPLKDRGGWFADLPPQNGEFAEAYGKTQNGSPTFDHSVANLRRKYGADWKNLYPTVVAQRLRAWGINTMGNWSYNKWGQTAHVPYTATFFYASRKLRSVNSGFPDVFDPSFAKNVNAAAKQWLTASANDPWCIGYFLDNEMPWGGETQLALDALRGKPDQPAKIELINWLKTKYADIAALNTAWGTQFTAYDALPVGPALKNPPATEAATKDLTEFNDRIAEVYFRTVHDAIKAVAPSKLYLGCRSVGGSLNTIRIATQYCDVVSYNRYCFSVRDQKLPGGLDAPMIIGEFHFGAADRGKFSNGLVSAENQQDRGEKYTAYVNSALDNPQIVGVHWFQYGDESTTGRSMDGENAQCGFVDVCDTPYVETTNAARKTADTMYTHRANAKGEAN